MSPVNLTSIYSAVEQLRKQQLYFDSNGRVQKASIADVLNQNRWPISIDLTDEEFEIVADKLFQDNEKVLTEGVSKPSVEPPQEKRAWRYLK